MRKNLEFEKNLNLKKICKGANVLDSLAIQGSTVYGAKSEVENWIRQGKKISYLLT